MTPTPPVPDISFCVTAHDRPNGLYLTLLSLSLQKELSYEIIVGVNATHESMMDNLEYVAESFSDNILTNETTNCWDHSELIAKSATGRYLCFPSEADYYTPTFGKQLLKMANTDDLDLAFCDCLYDYRHDDSYLVLFVRPAVCCIDKGGFLIKRNRFNGFPKGPNPDHSEGYLVESIVNDKSSKWKKLNEVLWVHN